jgi:hypothetical protein
MTAGFFRSLLAGILLSTGCAANVRDTDLLASNSLMLPPSTARTVFLQNRNASDNQAVSLHDLRARLNLKGYEVVQDPQAAAYVVLTNIVYCNQTKVELPVEDLVAGGYGSGIGGSIMSGLHGLTGMAGMAGPQGALIGGAAGMGLNAAEESETPWAICSADRHGPMPMKTSITPVWPISRLRSWQKRAERCRFHHRGQHLLPVSIKPGWRPACTRRNLMSRRRLPWCSSD